MNERRQAFRREAIEVDLGDRVVVVDPIPWPQRDDFGNEVLRQFTEVTNEAIKTYVDPDSGLPQLQAKLGEKFNDPRRLLELGLTSSEFDKIKSVALYRNQIVEILLSVLDVNELSQLRPLIDPNSTTPTLYGGILSDLIAPGDDTQKTEFGVDSLSPVSPETLLEPSPTPNSVPS